MSKQTEALKLALEALEKIGLRGWVERKEAAITAIREALADIGNPITEQLAIPTVITCPFCSSKHVPGWLHDYNIDRGAYGEQPTCKQSLQVWVIPNGKGGGQFSWEPEDERFWTRMQPAIKQDLTPEQNQCKFPMCHNEEYQQALAEQIKRELYTGEPAQPAQQRHISYVCPQCHWSLEKQPAQRKPLTDEQIEKVWRRVQANDFHDCVQPFARAIEAKLREKNE